MTVSQHRYFNPFHPGWEDSKQNPITESVRLGKDQRPARFKQEDEDAEESLGKTNEPWRKRQSPQMLYLKWMMTLWVGNMEKVDADRSRESIVSLYCRTHSTRKHITEYKWGLEDFQSAKILREKWSVKNEK